MHLFPLLKTAQGGAVQVAIHLLDEDSSNPRTEFPDAELEAEKLRLPLP